MRFPQRMFTRVLQTTLLGSAMLACVPSMTAYAHRPHYVAPHSYQDVSITLENVYGQVLPSYWHHGRLYVEGQLGEGYHIRLTNHSGERVEAVVSVDGRDVISGDLANYRKHRGYVIEPYGQVVIEGFRQSLDYVAAFRFSDRSASYSARRGTPQHVGVVGLAVFKEYQPRPAPQPPRPLQKQTYRPYDEDARYGWNEAEESQAPASRDRAAGEMKRTESTAGSSRSDSFYAPPPQVHQLGTEYGASQYSAVREVTFKRKSRRPDSLLTVYYDSHEGLRAQGVIVDPPPYVWQYPYYTEPKPFPDTRFAPPPP